MTQTLSLDERTEIGRGFSAGNFDAAYGCNDFESWLDQCSEDTLHMLQSDHYRSAYILGFFSSYTLDEIGSDREIFDDAYHSAAGKECLTAGYCDDRADEYRAEWGVASQENNDA